MTDPAKDDVEWFAVVRCGHLAQSRRFLKQVGNRRIHDEVHGIPHPSLTRSGCLEDVIRCAVEGLRDLLLSEVIGHDEKVEPTAGYRGITGRP